MGRTGFGWALVAILTSAFLPACVSSATFGRAEILIPDPEDSLWLYQRACEQEVRRWFVANLQKDVPDESYKDVADKLKVRVDEEKNTVILFVEAKDEGTAADQAMRLAKIAVLRFVDMDEFSRKRALEAVSTERSRLQDMIREQKRMLLSRERASGIYHAEGQIESLVNRLSVLSHELELAELESARLKAVLALLEEKNSRASNAVSFSEVLFLQEKERELGLEIDEASQTYGEKHPKITHLEEQLDKVRDEIAQAKEELLKTGGQELAAIIAERKLECESDAAAARAKGEHLRTRIQALRQELFDTQNKALESDPMRTEIGALEQRLQGLTDEEAALRTRAVVARKPEIVSVGAVEEVSP
ncbi:MAG: hypothetical protein Q8Q12_01190 [bacterium]|nr:hypothetical protein [bacterium]